jgi:hypothetical protein
MKSDLIKSFLAVSALVTFCATFNGCASADDKSPPEVKVQKEVVSNHPATEVRRGSNEPPKESAINIDGESFSYGYKYPVSRNNNSDGHFQCNALTQDDEHKISDCKRDKQLATCPKCEVDFSIRRCKYGADQAINIFPSKDACNTSLYDATEGD